MTDVEMAVENIRRSFERGRVQSPTFRGELHSSAWEVSIAARDQLIQRGLMDSDWNLTRAGRDWARGCG